MKKKYPEPYKRDDRKGVYYFTVNIDGTRKKRQRRFSLRPGFGKTLEQTLAGAPA
ncbi:MAG: hypothetical protein GVY23_02055 [Spirochaetes bacterium]|jgi:hypothetical protein|nr:hypothetical protein [Spirochaetota bacterium]